MMLCTGLQYALVEQPGSGKHSVAGAAGGGGTCRRRPSPSSPTCSSRAAMKSRRWG